MQANPILLKTTIVKKQFQLEHLKLESGGQQIVPGPFF
jgi:hypothetical protein